MVYGMASQTTEVRLDVVLADFRFVAVSATGQDDFRLDARIALGQFGITCVCVFNSGPVTPLAAPFRRVLAFQCLYVR